MSLRDNILSRSFQETEEYFSIPYKYHTAYHRDIYPFTMGILSYKCLAILKPYFCPHYNLKVSKL